VTGAVLAFDAGPGAGMGHGRRMHVLAQALGARSIETSLVASDTRAKADVVVVDSYRFRADDNDRYDGRVVVAVDDLRRDLAVDLLVDPSPGADPGAHRAATEVIAGAAYALIDPSLASAPTREVGSDVHIVLVATGAGDDGGTGATISQDLSAALPTTTVRLAVGPWATAAAPEGVDPIRTTDGLGRALADADIVVTAAGVTLLEALALGRPTVAVVLADNQRQAAAGAAAAGAVVLAEATEAVASAARLAADANERRTLASAARRLVDGRGADRVAERIAAIV
jgi:UDP-2,4-diacetamido-2,4,6-trideoxy-beta-L-altropyranose hydrolase